MTLTLSAALSADYRIRQVASLQGGASISDFVMNKLFLFPKGTTSVAKTFEAKDDDDDDDNESVLWRLLTDDIPRGVTVGTPATTTVSIIDDDEPPGVTVSPTN